MEHASKNILITGVSTGIGFGIAKEAVRREYRVFGSVRRKVDAEHVKDQLGASFTPLIFDVTKIEEIESARKKLERLLKNQGLHALVNNSGIAHGGPLLHQPMEEIRQQFEVNVFGLLHVTRAFSGLLGACSPAVYPPGKIINISSVGGVVASPFVGAYVGTKHAVEGISASLRRELLLYGIDVIVIGPGAVKTPIWDKGINPELYADTDYGAILRKFAKAAMNGAERGLTVDYIGTEVLDIIEKKNPKTRYALVSKPLTNWIVPRLLPPRWIDKYIKKSLFRSK